MQGERFGRLVDSLGTSSRDVALTALTVVEDSSGTRLAESIPVEESLDRALGLIDVVALTVCHMLDAGRSSMAECLDQVALQTEVTIAGIGFCGCGDESALEPHTHAHVGMAMQFLAAAAGRADDPSSQVTLEIESLCCDPWTVAFVLAQTALSVAAEHTGPSRDGITRKIRRQLTA